MRIIDISQSIDSKMPVYPGTVKPQLVEANSIDQDGFAETMLSMTSHSGTHMDAPAHILPNAPTLDKFPVEQFCGTAVIFDVSKYAGKTIPLSIFEAKRARLRCCNYVILKSNHDQYWGHDYYFRNYPVLSIEAAKYLAGLPRLYGIGMDMISPDRLEDTDYPIHKIFFAAWKVIVENLTNLDEIEGNIADVSMMPLKLKNADGSPVRAIAIVEEMD